jgi:hypothetical protein
VDPNANIIFGALVDDRLGDRVKITVLATGFDSADKLAPTPLTVKTVVIESRWIPNDEMLHTSRCSPPGSTRLTSSLPCHSRCVDWWSIFAHRA